MTQRRERWHPQNPPYRFLGYPYTLPRISAVEYGNGWRSERQGQCLATVPKEGEVVVRVRGGKQICPILGKDIVHDSQRLWIVLNTRGCQILCDERACVCETATRPGMTVVRSANIRLPDAIQHQLTQWLEKTRAAETLPSRRERPGYN